MELTDLKKGDKIYNLAYWNHAFSSNAERELRTVTVLKISGKRAILKGGYRWTITEKMFNKDWFPTKKECYEKALRLHEIKLFEFREDFKRFKKEVEYLKKKIKQSEVSANSSHS